MKGLSFLHSPDLIEPDASSFHTVNDSTWPQCQQKGLGGHKEVLLK